MLLNLCSIFVVHVSSKFQIYDFNPNPNFPLSVSEGIVELFPAGGEKITLEVPSETSGRYWIIGTFNGVDGLDGIDISNTIVENFNNDDLCGTRQNIQIADLGSMPPKVPTVNIEGRQRQSSIFNIDYESLPITDSFWN